MFGLCLFREFLKKMGGLLCFDFEYITFPCDKVMVKIYNEKLKSFHVETLEEENIWVGSHRDADDKDAKIII